MLLVHLGGNFLVFSLGHKLHGENRQKSEKNGNNYGTPIYVKINFVFFNVTSKDVVVKT